MYVLRLQHRESNYFHYARIAYCSNHVCGSSRYGLVLSFYTCRRAKILVNRVIEDAGGATNMPVWIWFTVFYMIPPSLVDICWTWSRVFWIVDSCCESWTCYWCVQFIFKCVLSWMQIFLGKGGEMIKTLQVSTFVNRSHVITSVLVHGSS